MDASGGERTPPLCCRSRTVKLGQPVPVPVRERERMIPKPGTHKRRRLGVPTVRDRVV